MYCIIVGCGLVGGRLANILSDENYNIVVIDEDAEAFDILNSDFNGITVEGNGIDEQVLEKAGIKEADALLAVTDDDNTNIMAAQVAKNIFGIKRVVTRVNNQGREYLYRSLGLETVNITKLGAFEIRNLLLKDDFQRCIIDDENGIEIINYEVKENLVGKSVLDLETETSKVLSLIRDGSLLDPKKKEELQQGDKIILAVTEGNYQELLSTEGGFM